MTYRLFFSFAIGLSILIWLTFYYHFNEPIILQEIELPDGYMEQVTAFILNNQGKLALKIETPQLMHYTKNDKTDFIQPTLTFYKKSTLPWYISANTAQAIKGMKQIQFNENVVIHRAADEHMPSTLIKTQTLSVFPQEKKAHTKASITLIQPNLTIKATGMQADINQGEIELLSQAKGEYVEN
jgi:lipopolysaccharide export system protein LptC